MKIINPYRFAGTDSLLTNLIAWWSMDEASGARVNNHNPGTHNFAENNGVGSTTGVVGNAAVFAGGGANDYFTASHHADLVIADNPFTIAGWAQFSSTSDTNMNLLRKGSPGAAGGEWQIDRSSTGQSLRFRVRNAANSAEVITASVGITYDVPFFFLAEHLPASDLISFEINRGTPATAALAGGSYSGTNGLLSCGIGTGVQEMAGWIDEWCIWKGRLLEDDEKDRLYAGMAYPG